MSEIIKGVLYGLAAELIVIVIVAFIAKLKNSSFFKYVAGSKIFKHGIEFVYDNQTVAMKDIQNDINDSNAAKLFCMRGRSFVQTDELLSKMIERRDLNIKYLVLDPDSNFALKRSEELNKPNYINELKTNIEELVSQTVGKSNIVKRKHNQPPIFRILILDKRVYFSFFQERKLGSQIPVFRAKKDSEIYLGLNRYFDYIWETSQDI